MIGDFEYLVLAATARLGDEAYGAAIRRVLADASRPASIGALYTTLDRLERKGLVTTRMGEATQARGGRAKRMVTLTEKGSRAASEFYSAIHQVSQSVSWAVR
jgi:PadR family transcriptional regulator, regulatory protein PadR